MTACCDIVTADLLPTRTYGRRSFAWVPADELHPDWDGRRGTLTITVARSARPGAAAEIDTYAVQEEAAFGQAGRSFLLLNLTDPDQPDVYRTVVGGSVNRCTCKAGLVGKFSCKHASTLSVLIAEGGI